MKNIIIVIFVALFLFINNGSSAGTINSPEKIEKDEMNAYKEKCKKYFFSHDFKKSLHWCSKVANSDKQNNPFDNNQYEQARIGDMYYYGYGVKKDYRRAFEWYKKSARIIKGDNVTVNYPYAQVKVAKMYLEGKGTAKNVEKGIYYLRKANSAESLDILAKMYLNGKNVEKNWVQALYYWVQLSWFCNIHCDEQLEQQVEPGKCRKIYAIPLKSQNMIDSMFQQVVSLSSESKVCAFVAALPTSTYSDIISDKNNTIDKAIEVHIGNLRNILINTKIGLGIQTQYSFQTFVNAIRAFYLDTKHNINKFDKFIYLLGQELNPDNVTDGIITALKEISDWTFVNEPIFGKIDPKPQYGTALLIIKMIRNNKITNPKLKKIIPKLKKIIAKLITGNNPFDDDSVWDTINTEKIWRIFDKINKDYCGIDPLY